MIKFEDISKGLINSSFIFEIEDYSFVENNMNLPTEANHYSPSFIKAENNAECTVDFYEEEEMIIVKLPYLDNVSPNFPTRFDSKIYSGRYNLLGEENDYFKIVVIPFVDMIKNPKDYYRMELRFYRGAMVSIGLLISYMDESYRVSEQILELSGKILE